MNLPLVVTPEALASANTGKLKIVDLRALEAYSDGHIPNAVHLDTAFLNRVEPPVGGLLPNQEGVNALAAAIGLQPDDHLVAYDAGGGSAAARLIWVLHAYGFSATSWLNGGFTAWQNAALAISNVPVERAASQLELQFRPGNVLDIKAVQSQLDTNALTLLDVRTAAEFAGTDVRSARGGHVPGAIHSEWTEVFDASGALKPDEDLKTLFANININDEQHVVVYCQTHQRSAMTYLVLKHLGFDQVSALDGAWSAWGNSDTTPIETGA